MTRTVEFGIFMPVASNGFLFSKHAPHYHPTFDQHRRIALLAEKIGIDYLFWMGKWKGFGGETGFWEQSLEPMTLVSGIAAVTTRIRLLATIAVSPDRSRQDDHDHSRGQQWPLWHQRGDREHTR
jgi:pyrimidine oxygenase